MGNKVLLIGESSNLAYVTYILTKTDWSVTTYNTNDIKFLQRNWSIQINNQTLEFKTSAVTNSLDRLKEVYDIVFMTEKFYMTLTKKLSRFKALITDKTIIIVDANNYPWLYDKVNEILPNNIVLAMFSEVDCRRLTLSENKFLLVNASDEKLVMYLGILSNKFVKPQLPQIMKFELQGKLLELFQGSCAHMNTHLTILQPGSYHTLNKLIWKQLIIVICFHGLSIIFEETNILKLAKLPHVSPIMKGSFQEILAIGLKLGLKLPTENSKESLKMLQILILAESNAFLKLQARVKYNFNSIDANKLYYDFVNGNEMSILTTINGMLEFFPEFNVDSKFLECIRSFMMRLSQVRNTNHSKIFHLKKRIINFSPINGIEPEKNMMNYPPFNPLPLPSPPTQFMSTPLVMMMANPANDNQEETDSDNDSVVTIDPEIISLVNGYSGKRETFFDSQAEPQQLQQTPKTLVPQQPPLNIPQAQTQQPQHLQQPPMAYRVPEQHYHRKLPPNIPYYHPSYYPNQTSLPYIAVPGGLGPSNKISNPQQQQQQQQYPPPYPQQCGYQPYPQHVYHSELPSAYDPQSISLNGFRKRPSYFHLQPNITKHTPVQQLRESHNSLLEVANFNTTMDQRIPSRYGRYDTSTAVINSGNNSRSSKASSSTSKPS